MLFFLFASSNAIRNDLVCLLNTRIDTFTKLYVSQQHPNEYIRGATLRFLQKIAQDAELLEPLIPTCRSCLVFAIYSIYREFENLIPDAPELMYTFLVAESDSTCKRNAFVFLSHCSMPKAVEYILSIYDTIPSLDESLQMCIIEVIRLDCKNDSAHRVHHLLQVSLFLLTSVLATVHSVHLRTPRDIITRRKIRGCHYSNDIDPKPCGGERCVCFSTHVIARLTSCSCCIVLHQPCN
jgi:hypothetical protein